jgi:phosphoglycerate dehydrogenase-like enzyme
MPKVLITPAPLVCREGPFVEILQAAGFELAVPAHRNPLRSHEVIPLLRGVHAVLASSEPYTREVLETAPDLRVIARAGVGYDAVDVAAATERGVIVTIAPGTNQDAVAELTFALLFAVAKRLVPNHQGVKAGAWPRHPTLPLRGRTLGIAGLGRIGKSVATRGLAFGMRLLACELCPDHAFVSKHGIELVPFERLLAESDFLSLHIPLTPQSRHIINRTTLALMKPSAFLINTARGGLVCEADLLEALQNNRLAGAGLDVFETEPPGRNPLFELDNVIMSPHVAGVDIQSMQDMAVSAAQAIADLCAGKWPADKIVNPEALAIFQRKQGRIGVMP